MSSSAQPSPVPTAVNSQESVHNQGSSESNDEHNNNGGFGKSSTKSGSFRSRIMSEKGEDEMYPMTTLKFEQKDVKKRYKGVTGPLSLFAPYPHEEVKIVDDKIEMERPVTPIDEEVKTQPLHFTQLAKYIRRRLAAKQEVQHLSTDEQQGLAGILMGEVNGIWPDIRRQIDDPFLSPDENKELNRRIAVHIVTVCEQLFKHYVDKAQILNKRGVFSGPANMSRLKAQLALDANKFLNVLMIRRYIVADMRGKIDSDAHIGSEKDYIYGRKPPIPKPEAEGLSYKNLIQQSRPKSKSKKYRFRTVEEDLDEMAGEMPSLDTRKLVSLVQQLPTPRPESLDEVRSVVEDEPSAVKSGIQDIEYFNMRAVLKRSKSMPDVTHEMLAEEMELELPPKDTREIIEGIDIYSQDVKKKKIQEKEKKDPSDRSFFEDDLRKLAERSSDSRGQGDDDLPPLIQAILRHSKHDGHKVLLDKKLKQLETKEQEEKANAEIRLQRPTHPQPATVPAKLPNKMVVRASDIRVSERVCMSSMTIQKTATVYNDLLDDITPTRIKQLDSNLFLGSEVKEVYQEIMKTVPTDHMDLEVDETIEPSANSVNLASAIASTTLLNGKKKNRIVNKNIQKSENAPWTGEDLRDWARTPHTPMKDNRAGITVQPMTPNDMNTSGAIEGKFIPGIGNLEDLPPMVAERMSRSYNSWLQWWKNTVNYDDYLKYLSNKETDYLAAVFHFYNSDDEDEEDERSPSVVEKIKQAEEAERDRQKKLEELRVQKAEFTPGMWNVNAVFLGGLGKDPSTEEENDASKDLDTPATDSTQKKKKTIQDLITEKLVMRSETDRLTEDRSIHFGTSRLSQAIGYERPPLSAKTAVTHVTEVDTSTPQEKLEKVWSALKMPDGHKLDMAIKYSSDDYIAVLHEAIVAWQRATQLVVMREGLMAELEKFERMASDPNRFFERGFRGSSVARLDEAKQRSSLYRKIESVSADVKRAVKTVQDRYRDTITYQGRPYLDKMQWDRTEMLYWLSEERRGQALEHEAILRDVPLKVLQLAPLSTN